MNQPLRRPSMIFGQRRFGLALVARDLLDRRALGGDLALPAPRRARGTSGLVKATWTATSCASSSVPPSSDDRDGVDATTGLVVHVGVDDLAVLRLEAHDAADRDVLLERRAGAARSRRLNASTARLAVGRRRARRSRRRARRTPRTWRRSPSRSASRRSRRRCRRAPRRPRPRPASRSARLAAEAIPCTRSHLIASSMLPSLASRARLASAMPTPVA